MQDIFTESMLAIRHAQGMQTYSDMSHCGMSYMYSHAVEHHGTVVYSQLYCTWRGMSSARCMTQKSYSQIPSWLARVAHRAALSW